MTRAIQMAIQKDMIGTLCIADQATLAVGDRSQLHTDFPYDCVLKQLQKTVCSQAKAMIMLNHKFLSNANACRKSGVSLEQPFDIFHKEALVGKRDGTLQQVTIQADATSAWSRPYIALQCSLAQSQLQSLDGHALKL